MKRQQKILFTLVLLINLLVVNSGFADGVIKTGDREYLKYHKDILLRDLSGNSVKLQDYTGNGRWLVVMIWSSRCKICNALISDYSAFYNKHKNRDASVLGISVDGWQNKRNAADFISEHQIPFPNLIAAPVLVDHLYVMQTGKDLLGTPSFLFYSPSGILKVIHSGAIVSSFFDEFIQQHNRR